MAIGNNGWTKKNETKRVLQSNWFHCLYADFSFIICTSITHTKKLQAKKVCIRVAHFANKKNSTRIRARMLYHFKTDLHFY